MELHTGPELELPDGGIGGDAPAGRQRRQLLAGMVADDQRFVDLVGEGMGRPLVLGMRIKRQRITGTRPFQGACFGDAREHRRRGEDREQAPDGHFHGTLPILAGQPPGPTLMEG